MTNSEWVSVRALNGAQGVEVVELGGEGGRQVRIVDGSGRVLEPAETVSVSLADSMRAEAVQQPWSRSSSRWG